MLDFYAELQTSRPRFDDGWTLGAEHAQSGNPPAVNVQVIIGTHGQSGQVRSSNAPHLFLFPEYPGKLHKKYPILKEFGLETGTRLRYNSLVYAEKRRHTPLKHYERI